MLIVHWIGGAHSEMRLPKRRRGQRNSTSADIVSAVKSLATLTPFSRPIVPPDQAGIEAFRGAIERMLELWVSGPLERPPRVRRRRAT